MYRLQRLTQRRHSNKELKRNLWSARFLKSKKEFAQWLKELQTDGKDIHSFNNAPSLRQIL